MDDLIEFRDVYKRWGKTFKIEASGRGGSQGAIHFATALKNWKKIRKGQKVALKIPQSPLDKELFNREIKVFEDINNDEYFLKYYGYLSLDDNDMKKAIVFERAEFDLEQAIIGNEKEYEFTKAEDFQDELMDAMFNALEILYGYKSNFSGYIHRDIKSKNIVFTKKDNLYVPKLIDFGTAGVAKQGFAEDDELMQRKEMSVTKGDYGTVMWRAPEVSYLAQLEEYYEKGKRIPTEKIFSELTDMYSLGLVLITSLARKSPFAGLKEEDFRKMLFNVAGIREEWYINNIPYYEEYKYVINKATAVHPDDRYKNLSEFKDDWKKNSKESKVSKFFVNIDNLTKSKKTVGVTSIKNLEQILHNYKEMCEVEKNVVITSNRTRKSYNKIVENAKNDFDALVTETNRLIKKASMSTDPFAKQKIGSYIFYSEDEKEKIISSLLDYVEIYKNDFGVEFNAGILNKPLSKGNEIKDLVARISAVKNNYKEASDLERNIMILVNIPTKQVLDEFDAKKKEKERKEKEKKAQAFNEKLIAAKNNFFENVKNYSSLGKDSLITDGNQIKALSKEYENLITLANSSTKHFASKSYIDLIEEAKIKYLKLYSTQMNIVDDISEQVNTRKKGASKKLNSIKELVGYWSKYNALPDYQLITWNKIRVPISQVKKSVYSRINANIEDYNKYLKHKKEKRKAMWYNVADNAGAAGALLAFVAVIGVAGYGIYKGGDWAYNKVAPWFKPSPNVLPIADFYISNTNPYVGESILLTSKSSDKDGDIVRLSWDTDSDGIIDKSGKRIKGNYSTVGEKTITLYVYDDDGAVSKAFKTINVRDKPAVPNKAPIADFSYSPSSILTGRTITFTDKSKDLDGKIVETKWDFDADGVTDAKGSNASYSFYYPGTKNIFIEVKDDDGKTSKKSKQVIVKYAGYLDIYSNNVKKMSLNKYNIMDKTGNFVVESVSGDEYFKRKRNYDYAAYNSQKSDMEERFNKKAWAVQKNNAFKIFSRSKSPSFNFMNGKYYSDRYEYIGTSSEFIKLQDEYVLIHNRKGSSTGGTFKNSQSSHTRYTRYVKSHKERVFEIFARERKDNISYITKPNGSVFSSQGDSIAVNMVEFAKFVQEYSAKSGN